MSLDNPSQLSQLVRFEHCIQTRQSLGRIELSVWATFEPFDELRDLLMMF
jgi:hypothetical protein